MAIDPVLRVPWGLGEHLRSLLHQEPFQERFLFAVARPLRTVSPNVHVSLLEQLLSVGEEDCDYATPGGLRLTLNASNRVNRWSVQIAQKGWIAVHLHSHPRGVDKFSATDDDAESALSLWLAQQGVSQFWSLVWPIGGVPQARLWTNGVAVTGKIYLGLALMSPDAGDTALSLDRQKAFGPGLQTAAERLRIGILGVGGIGMLALEQLARAGFRRFVLVDPDIIEVTNLNRLPGVAGRDLGKRKVNVGKRMIRLIATSLGHTAEVSAYPRDIYQSEAAQRALTVCDLILAVTDNELSRTMALQLALEAGREYLQAGTDITLGEDGAIVGLRAEVTGAEVGRYCPICLGRLSPAQAAIEARTYAGGVVATQARSAGYLPDVAAPAVMGLNAVAAGMLVTEIQRRCAGIGARDYMQLDLQSSWISVQDQVTPGHDCEVCGARRGPDG